MAGFDVVSRHRCSSRVGARRIERLDGEWLVLMWFLKFSCCCADITPRGVTSLPCRVPQGLGRLYASWGDLNLVLVGHTGTARRDRDTPTRAMAGLGVL